MSKTNQPRFTIELIATVELPRYRELLSAALNDPKHKQHGLEGIYAATLGAGTSTHYTIIVWRTGP